MAATLYGIKNCDTIKKARTWLAEHSIDYAFHDYKAGGVARAKLEAWSAIVGWEKLLNRAGTTFKKLPEARRANLDEAKAFELMMEQPSMIKRPVLELDRTLVVGFSPETYAKVLVGA